MAGAIMGALTHAFTPFLTLGRSLHPLQRSGEIPVQLNPVIGAAGPTAGTLGESYTPAAPLNLMNPPLLVVGADTIGASRSSRVQL